MSFSFFNSKSKKKAEKKAHFEEETLKLTKEDVLKIREELNRYEKKQSQVRNQDRYETRQGRKNEKVKERNHFLNVAIVVILLLLILVFYAVFHW